MTAAMMADTIPPPYGPPTDRHGTDASVAPPRPDMNYVSHPVAHRNDA